MSRRTVYDLLGYFACTSAVATAWATFVWHLGPAEVTFMAMVTVLAWTLTLSYLIFSAVRGETWAHRNSRDKGGDR